MTRRLGLLVVASVLAVVAVAVGASAAVDGGDRADDFDLSVNGTNLADADDPGIFGEGTTGFSSSDFYNLTRENISGMWSQNDTWTISGHVNTQGNKDVSTNHRVFGVVNVNDAQEIGVEFFASMDDADGDAIAFLSPCGSGNARLDDNDPKGRFHFTIKVESINNGVWAGLWINGTKQDEVSTTFKPCVSNDINYLVVGKKDPDGTAFGGDIHDLRTWDKSLSNSTIQNLPDTEEEGTEQAIWTFGDSLPFKLTPDVEFSLGAGARDVAVDYATTSNANVYVRTNPGSHNDAGKIIRFDEALAVQNRIIGCDGTGLRNVTGLFGLTVSFDNLLAGRCKTPGDDPVVAYYGQTEMLGITKFTPGDGANIPPRYMESMTLNRVVFDDGGDEDFYSANGAKDTVTRRNFGDNPSAAQVSIDQDPSNNVSWVAGQNGEGTFVASSMGGVQLVKNTSFTDGNVQIFNRTIWTATKGENITKLDIVNESSLSEVRRTSTNMDTSRGLRISPDGNFLLVKQSTDGSDDIVLRDAGNLSDLVTLATDSHVDDMAIDRCNNFVYAAIEDTENGNHKVQRFDVSQNTSTSAGGNGTTGLNPCPSNPFTQNTQGSVEDDTDATPGDQDFASGLQSRAASGFGVSKSAAGFILGSLFLLGFAVMGAAAVAEFNGSTSVGAMAGLAAGFAFTTAFGWIPVWFLLTMGTIAAAVAVFQR